MWGSGGCRQSAEGKGLGVKGDSSEEKVSEAASLSESSSLMPRLSVFEVRLATLSMILSLY